MRQVLRERAAQLGRWADGSEPPVMAVPTGIRRLNSAGLVERCIMTVIGGHTGDGKSVVRKQLARGAALAGCRVQEYVLEDPREYTADRILSEDMNCNSLDLRRLKVPDLKDRVLAAAEGAEWSDRVVVDFEAHTLERLMTAIRDRWFGPDGEPTDEVLVDYAQRFCSDGDMGSEAAVRGLADTLADFARDSGAAVVLFSQLKADVLARGYRALEAARWAANRAQRPMSLQEAVSGFRAGPGDLQWSSALQYRARSTQLIFRENRWGRKAGFSVPDNVMDVTSDKENYAKDTNRITLSFDGARARIWDPEEGDAQAA